MNLKYVLLAVVLILQLANINCIPLLDDEDNLGSGTTDEMITSTAEFKHITTSKLDPEAISTPNPEIDPTPPPIPTPTAKPNIETASIMEKYLNWVRDITKVNFKSWQIILITVGIILVPVTILIVAIICCCKKRREPEYLGAPSSFYDGYSTGALLKSSNKPKRTSSTKSMNSKMFKDDEAIIQATLERQKSHKKRQQKERIVQDISSEFD